ncbi:MAG: hypothetical protein H0W78_10190 [Planctomycetes bacterium]|nr:hypothetical protein [Planctomycetota bacterium]
MSTWRSYGLRVVMIAGAVVLIGWNSSRFLTAKPEIRAKDLDFLPAPETARVLALGHTNTLAKLRWVDSFAYFQYQLDRKDDTVAGGGTGFRRLYETLIALDPKFQPFYEHASLNTSGVLDQHWVALGFLMRGNQELPQSRELWRNTATTLKTFFHWDTKQPLLFDAFLAQWEAAEELPEAKRMVWDWKRGFGSRVFTGLEQLPYWLDQLQATTAGTPNGDYVDTTIRELLARFGARELNALATSWRIAQGGVPTTRTELVDNLTLIDPLRPVVDNGPHPTRIDEFIDPRLVRRRYPTGLPMHGPLMVVDGRLTLRSDPYGLPWKLVDHHVVSVGHFRASYEKRLGQVSVALLGLAQKEGRWPTSLEEAKAMGLDLPDQPEDGRLRLDGRQVVVDWSVEAGAPWVLRQDHN